MIYLYGWRDLNIDSKEMKEETKNVLTLFFGIMFGVTRAVNAVNQLSVQVAKQVVKRLPQKALTKGIIYLIVKKCRYYWELKLQSKFLRKALQRLF